jgi:hypothetical protein
MAYSGTISQTVFDTRRVIDNAFRRAKMLPETVSGEQIDIARDQLYLLTSNLANRGVPLWCVEKIIVPLYEGIGDVTLPAGTVDILNVNLRVLQEVTGANTVTSTTYSTSFGTDTPVTTVGVLWAAAAVPIIFERSTDGVGWITVQSETPSASAGEWTWFDVSQIISAPYFRVRATSGTLSYSQVYFGNNPTEIPFGRLNKDDYTNLPNKAFKSLRPLQYWFDRQVPAPVMHLWPVPASGSTVYQIVAWRHRHIMDVGKMTDDVEVPQRWLDAVISMLAAKLASEIPEVPADMIPLLDAKATQAELEAWGEERDNSPIRWAPNISAYTR